ncbi:acetylglutamate kinase [Lactiplantibacillus fabifermentans]|uniref:Acetylglutamate kinase n=1 Tax=Lactiplantibacillus fabifermentans DSM 21115 TaxID=1413187 RepID=A0A0R2P1E4_9LACO|nr:acetylglutamate kinase [Lactiplantibacillus fabifermentans]KRO28698.1 acetylglutamate kinase [Lactiplantibacillus fabifermentans DSM 21115]
MQNLIIVKIGGQAIQQLDATFFTQIKTWHAQGKQILIVHGGGPMITKLTQALQLPVHKYHGLRVTDAQTLAITKMVLLGDAQPALLSQLAAHGLPVIGLNAADNQLLTGTMINQAKLGAVGQVTAVNTASLQAHLGDHIGVLAPLALTTTGQWLNVNADMAATALAQQLHAKKLVLLTDVPGIMHHGTVMTTLSPRQAQRLTQQAVITAGMRPKVQAAIQAIQAGVQQAIITNAIDQPGTTIIQEAAI